jgi:uncharacterized protein
MFNFKEITAKSFLEVSKYSSLRPIYISEGQFTNQFIWAGYYNTMYDTTDKALSFLIDINNEKVSMMPYCKTEDIVETFFHLKVYFNTVLHLPLKMFLVDELFVTTLQKSDRFIKEFKIVEDRDTFDYMYNADKLKRLSGKALHKKKNHLNSFVKTYADRFEYRTLCCSDEDEIKEFHQNWLDERKIANRVNLIEKEEEGINRIFENCARLNCRLGGIYIDDQLEAYSIGSYAPHLKCAFIHVEKANININGLYNYINQQFLINEFPDAELVNREDDLGQEGLRKSKLSYKPVRLEKKFHLFEK